MLSGKRKFGAFHHPKNVNRKNVLLTFEELDDSPNKELFREQWNIIEDKLLAFTSSLFKKYVVKLYNFISSHNDYDNCDDDMQRLIPTAIITLGKFVYIFKYS